MEILKTLIFAINIAGCISWIYLILKAWKTNKDLDKLAKEWVNLLKESGECMKTIEQACLLAKEDSLISESKLH